MKKYLQKKYALSDIGTKNLIKAIKSSALANLSFMLPMMLAFIFLKSNMEKFFWENSVYNFKLQYIIFIICIVFIIMYIIVINDYHKCFTKTYDESTKSRINLAEKLKKLPLSYFGKKDLADLSSTIMSDTVVFEEMFSNFVPKVYASLISTFVIFLMMLKFDYRLTIALFWVLPVAFLIFRLAKVKSEELFKDAFDINREIIDDFQEGINLVQEIKAYNMERDFINSINEKYDIENKSKVNTELIISSVLNLSFILLKLGMVSVTIFGAYLFLNNRVDLFTYLAFIIISGAVFNPMTVAFTNMTLIMYLESVMERVKEINSMPSQDGSAEFVHNGYNIVFENVDFSYEDGVSVLTDVSFIANQGEVTALVGQSGSGKTTAAKLAARFWDIQDGKITIGGTDISTVDPETLLKEFSIVFQDVLLFNSTVMENIRLGKNGASDEEVKQVAKIARCDEFIEKLPEGYDTLIGENGTKLSGGERQRISIARALLKDAPIILLDESTASLDAENESKIQAGLSELIKEKTVIIIAHRMRTVIDADNIIVLKDGKVIENGKPAELIENGGAFASMHKAQFVNSSR